jgi:hypothetical protein
MAMVAAAWGGHATTLGRSEAVQAMKGRNGRLYCYWVCGEAKTQEAIQGPLGHLSRRKGLVKARRHPAEVN